MSFPSLMGSSSLTALKPLTGGLGANPQAISSLASSPGAGLTLPGLSSSGNSSLSALGAGLEVAQSTQMLMSQISTMMASVMTGLMAFIQQLMSSNAQSQQSPSGAPGSLPGAAEPSTGANSVVGAGSGAGGSSNSTVSNLKAGATGDAGPANDKGFISPLKKGSYTLGDGLGAGRNHTGQDMAAKQGSPVMAAKEGKVTKVASDPSGYGNYIEITHADGTKTLYAHMSSFGEFKEGQSVTAGNVIGAVGSTGRSTGPHLHFEIIGKDGTKLEPKNNAPL